MKYENDFNRTLYQATNEEMEPYQNVGMAYCT